MENFSVATTDFLANGFYQLYNELQDSEYPVEFDVPQANALITEQPIVTGRPSLEEPPLALSTAARDLELEVNVENFILEYSCVDFSQIWDNDIQLPEKTFLCDDSCESFLRIPVIAADTKDGTSAGESVPAELDTVSCTFMCPFENCRKVYAKPVHLKAHLRRHVGDKPYRCKWPNCQWRFSRSDELARHFRSHSGVKPYKCDYCPKCFSRSDHLAKHRKVHERKLSASKHKGAWISLPRGRPGRKPKGQEATVKVPEED